MRRFVLAATVLLAIPTAACSFDWNGDEQGPGVTGTGSGDARSFAVTGFDAVDVRGSDDVDVRVGSGFSIRATGPSAELDRLRIERDGNTLKIGRRNGTRMGWSKSAKVRVFVTMPRMTGAGVSGSGTLAIDRVEGTKFDGGIAGSGNMTIAALQVDAAELSIAGSGSLSARGTARRLEANIAGSGNIDAPALRAQAAEISVAGSGNVRAVVDGTAKVNIMGSGDVDLGGTARCTVSKMGSGSVRCGG